MNSDAEITFTVTSKTTLGPVDQSTLHHAWMSLFLHHSSLLEFFFYTLLNGILLPCDFSFFFCRFLRGLDSWPTADHRCSVWYSSSLLSQRISFILTISPAQHML